MGGFVHLMTATSSRMSQTGSHLSVSVLLYHLLQSSGDLHHTHHTFSTFI